jgi:lycopene cyclase domain-containing protein
MYLYLIILVSSVIIPLSLSFDKKVRFFRLWRFVLPAIFMSAAIFIIIDIIFASRGIWGFNPHHNMGIIIAGLPLEEYLFFILVPYSCLFIHYVYLHYSGSYAIPGKSAKYISAILFIFLIMISLLFKDRAYPKFYSLFTAIILLLLLFDKYRIMNSYFISYLIMLIPFLIVNALLTGTFLTEEVVWYNSAEIIGTRVLTIPLEDFIYLFSLMAVNLLIAERIRSSENSKLTVK